MARQKDTSSENGKGGNFVTRKNPFGDSPTVVGGAPDIASVVGIGSALDAVLKAECAILLGRTRDGGCVVITVLDGDDRHRTYCSTEEQLDAAFNALLTMYKE